MRHRVAGKHLGRSMGHRNALRKNLILALFEHERITTTEAKAQAIRAEAEKMITMAKRAVAHSPLRALHARRVIMARLNNNRDIVARIFDEYVPRYESRPGGYIRIYKLGPRKGDAASMVMMELVDREEE